MEEWRDIVGYEGKYQISNMGRVRNSKLQLIKLFINKKGYHVVSLYDNKHKTKLVHRLLMSAFIGQSELDVNHKDFNKINNNLSNLEYVTRKENINHFRKSTQVKSIFHLNKSTGNPDILARIEFLEWLIKDIPKNDKLSIIKACYEYVIGEKYTIE